MKNFIMFLLFLVAFLVAFVNSANAMSVKMLDVGQGEAFLIQTDTENLLIDTGDISARKKIASELEGLKIHKLILTHPHADHIANAALIIDTCNVDEVYDNGQPSPSKFYYEYLSACALKNIPHISLETGKTFESGKVAFECLNPSFHIDVNNDSLVLRLAYENFSMLFTGDIGFIAEAEILSRTPNLKSTVLKAAHHGSKFSSAYNFVQAVSPEIVFVSCGKNNRFGHPSKNVISTYENFSNEIFCTAFNGDVTLRTDGQSYSITTQKNSDWLKKFSKTNQITISEKIS